MRKLTAAVAVAAALAVPVVTATTAAATRGEQQMSTATPGWWLHAVYPVESDCDRAGQDLVNQGVAQTYNCKFQIGSPGGSPGGWYLFLFSN